MTRRLQGVALALVSLAAAFALTPVSSRAASFAKTAFKWPPWLSVEYPVNPYDQANRDALLLVHAAMRDGVPSARDLTGTAEGMDAHDHARQADDSARVAGSDRGRVVGEHPDEHGIGRAVSARSRGARHRLDAGRDRVAASVMGRWHVAVGDGSMA
jgi:hypothetical protein